MVDHEFDVFVSHASEDKASFVGPLVRALEDRGLRVWYDKHEIHLGDDFHQKMEEGLRRSAFGVVVLSPHFRTYWPEAELSALFNQERVLGTKRILPVLLEMSHEELTHAWPMLAARAVAHAAEDGVAPVADKIYDAVSHRGPSTPSIPIPHRQRKEPIHLGSPRPPKRLTWALVGIFMALALWLLFKDTLAAKAETPLISVFEHLETHGYVANRSLSGRFWPGDVIQIMDSDSPAPPILALRSEMCFPDLETLPPRPMALPEGMGSSESVFGLSGPQIAGFLPDFEAKDSATRTYRLVFENPQVMTVPKFELSGQFSESCVLRLDEARAAESPIESFATVYEAVIAEGMTMEITWESDISAQMQMEVRQKTEKALRNLIANPEANATPRSHDMPTLGVSGQHKTEWRVDGPLTLGYRARPMAYQAPSTTQVESGRHLSGAVSTIPSVLTQTLLAAVLGAGDSETPASTFKRGGGFIGRLAIQLQTEDGWQIVSPTRVFKTGDRFRFKIESSEPAQVFVFHKPPKGERSELWPAHRKESNLVEPGHALLVVPPPAAFQMQEDTGLETFSVALTKQTPRKKPLGNYLLRSLEDETTRGVGIVEDAEPWLYFKPGSDKTLAAVDFRLEHAASNDASD